MTRKFAFWLCSGAALLTSPALAQIEIVDGVTAPQVTDGQDITVTEDGEIDLETGTAVTVNSDNDVEMDGQITIEAADGATGIEIQSGNTADLDLGGTISLGDAFQPDDLDGDDIADGPFAEGTGRTGILISGGDVVTGTLTTESSSAILVEGNDSAGIRLAETAGLTGNIDLSGAISVVGEGTVGADIAGQVIGNLASRGSIATLGEGAQGLRISSDVDGSVTNTGSVVTSGYRFSSRPGLAGRELLGAEDLLQAGSAVEVTGNVTGGLNFDVETETLTAADGTTSVGETRRSSVIQNGSAPAILVDGQGQTIAIGRVAQITDATDPDFVANDQFAFINDGDVTANGVYNDASATAISLADVTLDGGIRNGGSIQVNTFRSGIAASADQASTTVGADEAASDLGGAARVIVIGPAAIAERINNSGVIFAQAQEAQDEIFADRTAVQGARRVTATAIDVAANAELADIVNSGTLSAVIVGRSGEAVAVRDASGTLTSITNTGAIGAFSASSDTTGASDTELTTIALDLRANTSGITYVQDQTVVTPSLAGDILLGSGDDVLDLRAGTVSGDIAFGAGDDILRAENTDITGTITDGNGTLVLTAVGSAITQTTATPLNVASASFEAGSAFNPTLDGATGDAGTLVATGDITFAEGTDIAPNLSNVVGVENTTFAIAQAGGTLSVTEDLDSLAALTTPFLYDTEYSVSADGGTLFVTLDLRSTDALGLDAVQAAGFTSAFEALTVNSDLASAIVNITDGDVFNVAYNQLLPEFSAAARQFVLANVDGAVGAVGSHLDNARRSQEKSGGVWFEQFGYFADREKAGLSEQYRGSGYGFTGGVDTALGPFHAVGVNVGFATTEIEDVIGVDEPLDIITAQLGLYAGLELGGLSLDAYGGVGFNDFESTRNVEIGAFSSTADGDWSGTHYNASLRAGYDIPLGGRFFARPTASLDYLSLDENAYTEEGDLGIALELEDRTVDYLAGTVQLNLGMNLQGKRTWIRPSIRAGYRNEFDSENVITSGRFAGLTETFELEAAAFPDEAFLLGFTVAAGSAWSSFSFDLDSDIRDGFIRHTGRVVVRLLF